MSSADHLYVKTATEAWLQRQGHTPRYRFIDPDDAPIGSVVEIDLDGHKMRIHMNPSVQPDWDAEDGELILGPGVRISPGQLARRGYVNRVKLVSDGNQRILQFGTEVPREGTTWGYDTADCEVTPEGLLKTPLVARVWREGGPAPAVPEPRAEQDTAPVSASRRSTSLPDAHVPVRIGALVRRLNTAVRTSEIILVRGLCREAEHEMGRCEGLALDKLEAATSAAQTWLQGQDRLRQVLFTRLQNAVEHRHASETRSLLRQVNDLLKRGEAPSEDEAATLAAAKPLTDIVFSGMRPAARMSTRGALSTPPVSARQDQGVAQVQPARQQARESL
ncbi:hypothetical protein [Streptomyces sp. V1I1]|uniref:hypothetical protein n=1 Tax=Streptomyces sp. V1I1 TaxID=3042272 RepID=UPI0027D7F41F|nr:hypothetical protein [Streptomyces sp. V1I1]